MKYGILSFLLSWVFPTRQDRQRFRKFCEELDNRSKIKAAVKRYPHIIKKIKSNTAGKIKVLFLVNEISKWKTGSLYELMKKSERFEPVIGLTVADWQKRLSKKEKLKLLDENYNYFTKQGMNCVFVWDKEKNKAMSLKNTGAEIVFYQQPWFLPKIQQPEAVSEYALTCYVPYFVPNYGILNMDCLDFHKFLFRNYVLNKDWENIYRQYSGADNMKSVGHTMLDSFYLRKDEPVVENYVIYAPHWSIPCKSNKNDENYATFLWSGKLVLEYAQNHPEINWAFKPHPTLRHSLKKSNLFTDEEIDNYYREWEKIAKTCTNTDYTGLFIQSKAMITDCASFLVEYFCTGKPVIHLISDKCTARPPEPTMKIFNTFYPVHNKGEFFNQVDNLLNKNNDYKKEIRQKTMKELNLEGCYAAQNILTDLENIINDKGENNAERA